MVLDGNFTEYIIKARKKKNSWYVAGLNGESQRRYTLNPSFLEEGIYKAIILKDGKNSNRIGTDYMIETKNMNKNTVLEFKMEKGGGFIVLFEKQ
jgi:alpha-glucosidase